MADRPGDPERRLEEADEAASVAHDFIWGLNGVTQQQASDAIWVIHNVLRPLSEPGSSAADSSVGERQGRQPGSLSVDDVADRPGDPDAAAIRQALELTDRKTDAHQAAWAALDRIEARHSAMTELVNFWHAEFKAGERRLSVYEQALRAIDALADFTPYDDPLGHAAAAAYEHAATRARAALTSGLGNPADRAPA
jgi:hypothetical protein